MMQAQMKSQIGSFQGERMKRAAMLVGMLSLTAFVCAAQEQPAAKPGTAPQGAAAPATPPQGKRPPQAKTQPEFDAYKAVVANSTDAVAMQKGATDFATKFPDSELRVLLFRVAMSSAQTANNADLMMNMGEKVLALDPDDPEALVGVAQVLVERTQDSDLDRDQRFDQATKDAQRSLETIDTDITVPPGTPQEKVDGYKAYLRSTAYSIIGTLQYKKDKFADAEVSLRKSIDAFPSQPDPVAVLRLALALDKQDKYPEALKEAGHAVELTKEGTNVGKAARDEQARLTQLVPGAQAPAAQPAAPKK
jgi:tetratricopeptide (TPR) repeat protein